MLESGRSAEEVCRDHPERLDELRRFFGRARAMEDELRELFPPAGELAADVPEISAEQWLPRIPGYDIEGVLGYGGMGVVYKARHRSLNRTVAIKMPIAGAFASVSDRQRHVREAQAVAALGHPNIITVHDVGEVDGHPYFTMEFVDGEHLGARLASTPLPAREAAAMVAKLADAVACAHKAGIVHRDLKPANILLGSDGVPKIADFGLARHHGPDATLTEGGFQFGTPSYMSPEQARGQPGAHSPCVDIYSLGAILYEMVTGRPPFRAESSVETMRQVLESEPVPPSRLNAKVPRDLETICLTCLRKDPRRRYASADDLADDLGRFLRGEPVRARRAASAERVYRWLRRRPAIATAILSLALLVSGTASLAIWHSSERAARAAAGEQDLLEAVRLQRASAWNEAEAAIERAAIRLDGGGPPRLRRMLEQARRDSRLVEQLERVRLDRVSSTNGFYNDDQVGDAYARLFRDAGIFSGVGDQPAEAGERVRSSPVRAALLDAIDLWIVVANDSRLRDTLQQIAWRVDPSALRARLFGLANHPDQASIDRLVGAPAGMGGTPMMFAAFAERVENTGLDTLPLRKAVQEAYPVDFWANMQLADALMYSDPPEATRYYQAALVLRPDASVVYNGLGISLGQAGRNEEAARAFEAALRLDPQGGIIRVNYASTLNELGRYEEAATNARAVLAADEETPEANLELAISLFNLDRAAEGAAALRDAAASPAISDSSWYWTRDALIRAGLLAAAKTTWAYQLSRNPPRHSDWDGYAELCLYLGDEAVYEEACQHLLERFGQDPDPGVSERVGRACLLRPVSGPLFDAANAAVQRAMASEQRLSETTWRFEYYRVAGSLAAYRGGDDSGALSLLGESSPGMLGPMPLLIRAMAQHRLGDDRDARDVLAQAIASYDWDANPATREAWMCHILRREAEAAIR